MRNRIRSALVAITAAMLLGSGAALAESNACKADLTGDLVVNFADLAVLKSVFFQRCNDPGPTCGDGVAQGPEEQCDDGNVLNGDACSETCTIEVPTPPGPSQAFPATGQATCWNSAGTVIPCAGTGHDGEIRAGATLAYVDNGDGTITDSNTGLMWEKLSDDGTIHDWNNSYAWDDAFSTKVATLNGGGGFAGHSDWRMPNIKELQSIANYELLHPGPMVTAPSNAGCPFPCALPPCSCTPSNTYWPSSSSAYFPYFAWAVYFYDGNGYAYYKTYFYYVRAVRGGS
jgi:cysteine-rich repeat protein